MQLSFVVPQKKKRKLRFNIKAFITLSVILLAVAVNLLLGFWLGAKNLQNLTHLIKPPFYVSPIINATISGCVLIFGAIGIYFSVMFEPKRKQIILYSAGSFVLNLLLVVFIFIFNSLPLSLLAIVSNTVVCCFYFKQLKTKSLGQMLFIPYIIWLLFNTVTVYSLYLLN